MKSEATIAYPFHDKDGGALLPTSTGGLICGRCHEVDANPSAAMLIRARSAHKAAGESPLVLGKRPAPSALRVVDLSPAQRKTLCAAMGSESPRGPADRGSTEAIDALREASVTPLVALGLVTVTRFPHIGTFVRELTEHGARLARLCAEWEASESATPLPLFDLGPPDPAALRRLDEQGVRRRVK